MPYLQVHGCSDLVRARSRLLTDGMKTPADRFILIDSDMGPTADDLVSLATSERVGPTSAVSGCYVTETGTVAAVTEGIDSACTHGDPRFIPLLVAGLGFAAVSRTTVETIAEAIGTVRDKSGEQWHPFFLPFVLDHNLPDGTRTREYVPEDYSFWWRMKTIAKAKLWLDTHLAVGHLKQQLLMPGQTLSFV